MPRLVALKEHRYGDRIRAVGDVYEATEKHAKLLKIVKKAADAPSDSVMRSDIPDPVPVAAEATPAPRRGRYARRDLRASEEARVMTASDFPSDD